MPQGGYYPGDIGDIGEISYIEAVRPRGLYESVDGPIIPLDRTIITKMRPSMLRLFGSVIRLELMGPQDNDEAQAQINAMYIGPAVSIGQAWDFSAASQVFVEGAGSFALNGIVMADPLLFNFDSSKALIAAFDVGAGSKLRLTFGVIGAVTFYKESVAEAGLTPRGQNYIPQDEFVHFVSAIQIGS